MPITDHLRDSAPDQEKYEVVQMFHVYEDRNQDCNFFPWCNLLSWIYCDSSKLNICRSVLLISWVCHNRSIPSTLVLKNMVYVSWLYWFWPDQNYGTLDIHDGIVFGNRRFDYRCGTNDVTIRGCPWLVVWGWTWVGWFGVLSLVGSCIFSSFYVVVWRVWGAPPPLKVGESSLVLTAIGVGTLALCLVIIRIIISKRMWGLPPHGLPCMCREVKIIM